MANVSTELHSTADRRPLVAHILDRLDVGGLETVMVELINATSATDLRHVVICLCGYTEFRHRIQSAHVECYALGKRSGKDPVIYWRLWRFLRTLKPDLVQTYNIGAIDAVVPARLAGVRAIAHAEHGRSAADPDGTNAKYNRLRRLLSPLIGRYITVSKDLDRWLCDVVRLPRRKITHIYNGVDLTRYAARNASGASGDRKLLADFAPPGTILLATVGRLDPVKDQAGLIRAFARAVSHVDGSGQSLRLLIVGDGPEAGRLADLVCESGCARQILLSGSRNDVPDLLPEVDVFVSSSVAEGIALTILEAMACAKPVIATTVGGNPELVIDEETGLLVPPQDEHALAMAILRYVENSALAPQHGAAGLIRVTQHFSLDVMIDSYLRTYRELLKETSSSRKAGAVA